MADLVDGVADEVEDGSVADEVAGGRAAGWEDGVAHGMTTISADGPGSKVGSSPSFTSRRCLASVPSSGGEISAGNTCEGSSEASDTAWGLRHGSCIFEPPKSPLYPIFPQASPSSAGKSRLEITRRSLRVKLPTVLCHSCFMQLKNLAAVGGALCGEAALVGDLDVSQLVP